MSSIPTTLYAYVQERLNKQGQLIWLVVSCPYCGLQHEHKISKEKNNVRVSHCATADLPADLRDIAKLLYVCTTDPRKNKDIFYKE